jgi:hypothetical protein
MTLHDILSQLALPVNLVAFMARIVDMLSLCLGCCCGWQGSWDEPMWRKIMRKHMCHRDPAVWQQAYAALKEYDYE